MCSRRKRFDLFFKQLVLTSFVSFLLSTGLQTIYSYSELTQTWHGTILSPFFRLLSLLLLILVNDLQPTNIILQLKHPAYQYSVLVWNYSFTLSDYSLLLLLLIFVPGLQLSYIVLQLIILCLVLTIPCLQLITSCL